MSQSHQPRASLWCSDIPGRSSCCPESLCPQMPDSWLDRCQTGQRGASQRRARRPARPIFSWSPLKSSVGQNHVFRVPGPVLSQPQRSTNERTCDGVYSPSTGTSATRLSFLSLRDSGLALHPSLARGHFLARFCTAVFPLAGGGSITVSLVVYVVYPLSLGGH